MAGTQVVPLMKRWRFATSLDGSAGVRVYIDASARPDLTGQDLPDIGVAWDADWPDCTCKSIETAYVSDHPDCPREYTCNYDTQSSDFSVGPSTNKKLPVSIQLSNSYRHYENGSSNSDGRWTWESTGKSCGATFTAALPDFTESITVQRWVYGADLDYFHFINQRLVGHVNDKLFWPASPGNTGSNAYVPEQLLYLGSDLTEQYDENNRRRWLATIKFEASLRSNDLGNTMLGWNYEWNPETALWDKPRTKVGNRTMFTSTDFTQLFTVGQRIEAPKVKPPVS